METTNELLDRIKTRYALPSDYALAGRLGLTRSMVSAYRMGKRHLGDDAALKVADLLDLDPGYVLASMEAERSQSEAARAAWARLADFVKHHGAAALLALSVAPWLEQFVYYVKSLAHLVQPLKARNAPSVSVAWCRP